MDREYFQNLKEIKAPHFVETKEVRTTKKRKVLEALLDAFPNPVPSRVLNNIMYSFGQRFFEYRNEGWAIETASDPSLGEGVFVYWLESPVKGDKPYEPKYEGWKWADVRMAKNGGKKIRLQDEIFEQRQMAFRF